MVKNNKDEIKILKTFYTSKNEIGICKYKNNKYFYKRQPYYDEYENYKQIKPYFKVSKEAIKLEKYILYEYICDFKNKTINDYLYGNHLKIDFEILSKQYKKSINNTLVLMREVETKSKKYFLDRLSIVKQNIEQLNYKNIVFDGKIYDLKLIFEDIFLNIIKEKKLYSFISQGDPTDTNITISGYFTDFENSGYNTILSEFSIIFVSLFSHGLYFYPKYNNKAYSINKKILNKYKKLGKEISYSIKENNIYIDYFNNFIPKKNTQLISSFIELYSSNKKYYDDFKLLRYYICMRLLTPIDIFKMEEKDRVIIFVLIIIVYNNIYTIDDIKKIL